MTFRLMFLCLSCQHFIEDAGNWHCTAFPGGIPEEILEGSADHHYPFDGDHGIRYMPKVAITQKDDYYGLKEQAKVAIVNIGTASSGNWGHAGRPGQVGGSAPGGGGTGFISNMSCKSLTVKKHAGQVARAKAKHKDVTPETLAIATAREIKATGYLGNGAIHTEPLAPFDILLGKNAIEVKTIFQDAENDKVTVHSSSPEDKYGSFGRKQNFADEHHLQSAMVVFNDNTNWPSEKAVSLPPGVKAGDERQKSIWFGMGVGSYRTHGLTTRSTLVKITPVQLNQIGRIMSRRAFAQADLDKIIGR